MMKQCWQLYNFDGNFSNCNLATLIEAHSDNLADLDEKQTQSFSRLFLLLQYVFNQGQIQKREEYIWHNTMLSTVLICHNLTCNASNQQVHYTNWTLLNTSTYKSLPKKVYFWRCNYVFVLIDVFIISLFFFQIWIIFKSIFTGHRRCIYNPFGHD